MKESKRLISIIVNHSCKIKYGEKVYICVHGSADDFTKQLVEQITSIGAIASVSNLSTQKLIGCLKGITEKKAKSMAEQEVSIIKECAVFITIIAENIEIPKEYSDEFKMYNLFYKKQVRDTRLKYCRWIGIRIPNQAMAEMSHMNINDFESFYYDACCVDYVQMQEKNIWLAKLITDTKKIEIIAPQTHLVFTKEGFGSKMLCGEINLPDGEIYTAPNKYSANGVIQFNTTAIQNGIEFTNIKLNFEDGRVVESHSSYPEEFEKVISIDDGAKYIGEFAVGINEHIKSMCGITLFDEKKLGSIHIALGQCYSDCNNKNNSALHWDLVLDLTSQAGGGKIYFDDMLVCNDGKWNKL